MRWCCFAAAGRLLDQIVVARPVHSGGSDQLANGLALVESWEDHGFLLHLPPVVGALILDLQVEESCEQFQQAMPLQHLFPKVGGAVVPPSGIRRIARAAVAALVEGQKIGGWPRKPRGHVDFLGIDREVDQRALLEFEDLFPVVAVVPVLADRVGCRLSAQRILQLQRDEGNSVDAQRHIKTVIRPLRAEMELTGDTEDVPGIAGFQIGIEPVGRFEKRDSQRLAVTLEPMPKRCQHAMRVHPLAEGGKHPFAGLLLMHGFQLLPDLALGRADEIERDFGKDCLFGIEFFRSVTSVAVRQQHCFNRRLECCFGGGFHISLRFSATIHLPSGVSMLGRCALAA